MESEGIQPALPDSCRIFRNSRDNLPNHNADWNCRIGYLDDLPRTWGFSHYIYDNEICVLRADYVLSAKITVYVDKFSGYLKFTPKRIT